MNKVQARGEKTHERKANWLRIFLRVGKGYLDPAFWQPSAPMRPFGVVAAGFVLVGVLIAGPARAEQPFESWGRYDERSTMRIDHEIWEDFLLHYVRQDRDGVHRLAYGSVKDRDRKALARYVDAMVRIQLDAYRRSEQLAYWINLYNALLVKLVLDHYPLASIRQIERQDAGLKGSAWEQPLVEMNGVPLSLDDIEKRILQPIWADPRLYYAITCAAIGCPNLQPIPFSGDEIERQLSDAAMAYVNDPRCISIKDGELRVSSLYRWHFNAFGGSDQAIIRHLLAYAEPELAMSLQEFDRLNGDHFDWRLNDAANAN